LANPDWQRFVVADVLRYVLTGAVMPPAQAVCPRTSQPPKVDGVLDDPVWRTAAPLGEFSCFGPREGKPPFATEAKMAWDDANLYVAFRCEDPDVWSTLKERDANLWEGEVCEVYVDPDGDGRHYKEFELNPLNAVIDLDIPQGPDIGDVNESRKWNSPEWKTAVHVAGTVDNRADVDQGWTAEMAIPLADLKPAPHLPPQIGDTWRVQLYRIDRSKSLGEKLMFAGWSPTDTFHNPKRFGYVTFGGDPMHEDFSAYPEGSDGSPTWQVGEGKWSVQQGAMVGADSGTGGWMPTGLTGGVPAWKDYRVSFRFKALEFGSDGRDGPWVGVRYGGADSGYTVGFYHSGQVLVHKAYQGAASGDDTPLANAPWKVDDAWHQVAITVKGARLQVELDGKPLIEVEDRNHLGVPPVPSGGLCFSARKWSNSTGHTRVAWDDIKVEPM
jgi:hypothetical protein